MKKTPETSRWAVVPDAHTELASGSATRSATPVVFSVAMALVGFAVGAAAVWCGRGAFDLWAIAAGVVCAALLASAVRVAAEWERVVILRFGAFSRVAGPGLFACIPLVDSVAARIDNRVRVTTFGAEETLTSDLVPLDVDAALFWMVFDAKAAAVEVCDFTAAVQTSAQTALRDAIGRGTAAEVAIRRSQLDRELKAALEEKVGDWGIAVLSVEVRDIVLPKDLQDVMSLEAQAEQRRKARMALMETEADIADMLADMAGVYEGNEAALRLRQMHLLSENLRDGNGTFVLPSNFAEGFGDLLGKQ